ncbi:carbohydrate-binding module family 48 protein [Coniophora puteana RWD-64-598 SS2]|uniref:Carbohydrate-binding module family 48 protein n=1 Tax=Coniophora puteana (strain RWD-64-598) TaxID=741705 RepID=A0A5M3MTK1_CONPW|nr:carbohydrate-binding module family 48 protein [Coniophora puteana RWD-64-598 SS2]EIW82488.1 carbohydrate-binding module family 48 protein [Coniophora puteana RWD-64-598 SS2]
MTTMHEVSFTWPHTNARDVVLTGTFDKWSRSIHMSRTGGGYESRVAVPWGEKVAYKFIVDGRWTTSDQQPTERDRAGNLNNVYHAPQPAPAPEPVMVEEKEVQADPVSPTDAEYSTPHSGASDAGVVVPEETESTEPEAEAEAEADGLTPDTPILVEEPETIAEAVDDIRRTDDAEPAVTVPEETSTTAQEAASTAAVAPTAPIAIVPLLPLTEQPPAYARESRPATDPVTSPPVEIVATAERAHIPVDEVIPTVPSKEDAEDPSTPPAEAAIAAEKSNSLPPAPGIPPPSEKNKQDTARTRSPTTEKQPPASLSAPSSPAGKTGSRLSSMRLTLPRHKRQASLAASTSQTSEDGTLSTADNSPPGSRFGTVSGSPSKRRSIFTKIKDAFSDKDKKEQKSRARREATMS